MYMWRGVISVQHGPKAKNITRGLYIKRGRITLRPLRSLRSHQTARERV